MPETSTRTDGAAGEAMELWRNWLTETERQWNSFFAEVMGRDSFGRVAGSYMEAYSVVQRALNQGMERYLNTFNLPTQGRHLLARHTAPLPLPPDERRSVPRACRIRNVARQQAVHS